MFIGPPLKFHDERGILLDLPISRIPEPEWSRAGCCTHRITDALPRRAAAGGPAVGPSAHTPGLLRATDPCSAPIPGRCCRPPAVGCARTSVGVPFCTANRDRTAWIGWYAA